MSFVYYENNQKLQDASEDGDYDLVKQLLATNDININQPEKRIQILFISSNFYFEIYGIYL